MAGIIGVLTGGGDVPGLNACIKTIVALASEKGMKVLGIRRGWAGLLDFDLNNDTPQPECVQELDPRAIRAIDRSGGTHLHTSRTNPGRAKIRECPQCVGRDEWRETEDGFRDYTPHVLKVIERLGIDRLIPIGGDDTLGYGARLDREGVPVVCIPKTMDNDVFGTDMCIGFSTAVTRSVNFITDLRTNVASHERIGVVELFGRHSGETSLISAHLAGADRAAEMLLADRRDNPSRYSICTISEGARMKGGERMETGERDAFGHRKLGGIGQRFSDHIRATTGRKTIYQQVAYLMRAGAPDALDRMLAISFANLAFSLIENGRSGRMVALSGGRYTHVPASMPAAGVKKVDVDQLYNVETYRPEISDIMGKPLFLY